jgi:hypothetical protein
LRHRVVVEVALGQQQAGIAIGITVMSPELGFALFVTLLWGPTVLWLGLRTLRGRRERLVDPFSAASGPTRSPLVAPDQHEMLVDPERFWICTSCRSLNRSEAHRCYSCRTAKGSTGGHAPAELPAGPGVPVMAESIARTSAELPAGPGVPVMAEGIARTSGEAGIATVALAAPRIVPPAPESIARAPERALSAAAPQVLAGVPVCPFLGFRADPSTRYDFPDPANLCHAASRRGTTPVASPLRFVPGNGGHRRPEPIGVGHQGSCCLTAEHVQCARYPAVETVASSH